MKWLLGLLLVLAQPTAACRLALVLALDVSSSVDMDEYRLQIDGLATALAAPDVQDLIFANPTAPVALHVFEWSGRFDQVTVQDWRLLRSYGDLAAVIETIRAHPRSHTNRPTALGHALGHALRQFDRGPACQRRTVDVSGDGPSNDGLPPHLLYARTPLNGAVVNGLAIGDGEVSGYYFRNVIQGPGAFVEWAFSHHDFAETMRRKLIRELGFPSLSQLAPER